MFVTLGIEKSLGELCLIATIVIIIIVENAISRNKNSLIKKSILIVPFETILQGVLVPRLLQKRLRRILSVEVHRVRQPPPPKSKSQRKLHASTSDDDAAKVESYEECVIRVWFPFSPEARKRGRKKHRGDANSSVMTASGGSIGGGGGDDDERSLLSGSHTNTDADESMVSPEFVDTGTEFTRPVLDNSSSATTTQGWKAKYRFPIKTVSVKSTRHHSVTIEINLGKERQVREIIFDTVQQSEQFQAVLEKETAMDQDRVNAKMKVAMGGETMQLDEVVTFLVEIVSGWNLPIADFTSSDPFVKCLMDGKEVHRTAYISKTLEPVWTVSTGSLFLLTVDVKQLFRGEGLLCVVYDFDKLGKNDRLGSVVVPPKRMYDANGERMEFKLGPPPGKTEDVPGDLVIRVRRASDHDKEFMAQLKQTNRKLRLLSTPNNAPNGHDFKGGSGNIRSMITRRSRIAKSGPNSGQREVGRRKAKSLRLATDLAPRRVY